VPKLEVNLVSFHPPRSLVLASLIVEAEGGIGSELEGRVDSAGYSSPILVAETVLLVLDIPPVGLAPGGCPGCGEGVFLNLPGFVGQPVSLLSSLGGSPKGDVVEAMAQGEPDGLFAVVEIGAGEAVLAGAIPVIEREFRSAARIVRKADLIVLLSRG
jgi:hypothetical protein